MRLPVWSIWQDVRFGARMLMRDRGFTLAAVLLLGLGLGVNTTVFTIVNAMNLRGLPVERADQILQINSRELGGLRRESFTSHADFRDWQRGTRTFAGLAAYTGGTMTIGDERQAAERLAGSFVTANAFPLLRVTPAIGRHFSEEDDRPGAQPVVILADAVWRERYGADRSVIGRVMRLNGAPATVIGVMPPGFHFPLVANLWQPMAHAPALAGDGRERRDRRSLNVFGRLRDDETLTRARAELQTLTAALAQAHPDTNTAIGANVVPFTEQYTGPVTEGPPMIVLAAGAFVLLIACANAANLLLARAFRRSREVAVRVALGASRPRIVRQLLIESLLLSAMGGAAGLALAVIALQFFTAETADMSLPFWVRFEFDAGVFAYVAAVCLGTALLFGLAPAWQLAQTTAHEAMKASGVGRATGRRTRRWVDGLLIGEVALTLVLLAGAGLLVRSGLALADADAVLDMRALLTARIALPPAKYATPEQRHAFYRQLQERLDTASPSISSATLATARPFVDANTRQLVLEGETFTPENPAAGRGQAVDGSNSGMTRAAPRRTVQMVAIGDRYFETLGLPLRRGRGLTRDDARPGQEAIVVNERFAAQYFPGVDPIGRRVRLPEVSVNAVPGPWFTIAGVSPSVRQEPVNDAAAIVYLPLPMIARPGVDIAVIARGASASEHADRRAIGSIDRGTGTGPVTDIGAGTDIAAISRVIRDAVRALDADAAIYQVQSVQRLSELSRWNHRVIGTLLMVFAMVATMLSALGLYAVTSYGMSQRTAEIGLRMALGARPAAILWLFVRRNLIVVAIGVALGVAGAAAAGQVIRGLLVRTSASDPVTLTATIILLAAVAAAACVIPARRAARLDPLAALQRE
jgi:putative ABC transport system permease protein